MPSSYKTAIKDILFFKKKTNKSFPSVAEKLKGDLGEFYVLDYLEKKGFEPIMKCGQAGCDIILRNGVRVEVRTSLLKNEGVYPKGIDFWGWRVKNRNQKKDEKFDIMVGVALDKSWANPLYYIFTHKEAFSVSDINIGRFRSVQKKIHLFLSRKVFHAAVKAKPAMVTRYERYINLNRNKFLNKWHKIRAL